MAHDVFISYASKDKTIADAVCATLEARRVRCWIAPRDILPGVPYAEALIDALNESRVLVLVFSAEANISPSVIREVERACNKGVVIVPVRIEDVAMSKQMEFYLSSQHWLDALTPPMERHLEQLAESVRVLVERMDAGRAAPGESPEAADRRRIEAAAAMAPAASVRETPETLRSPAPAGPHAVALTGPRVWADEALEQLFLSSPQPYVRDLFLLAKEVNFNGQIQWRGRKSNASFNIFVPTRHSDGSLSANILTRYDLDTPHLRVFLNWTPDLIRPDALAAFKSGLGRLVGSAADLSRAAPAVPLDAIGPRLPEFRELLLVLRDAQLAGPADV